MKSALKNWAPAVFVYALVWYGSSLKPASLGEHDIFRFDKLLHVGEYFVVGMSLGWGLRNRIPYDWRKNCLWLISIGLIWAFSDELHQGFSGRDASVYDIMADFVGLVLYCLVLLNKRVQKLLTASDS